ncbi:hypothetical protein CYLTODRAFT_423925 [Cylindrobasidium torrendii FP15055 ss-10]|uniref:Uncharacterized protein n=1 Tax=Cylindrobasidium torrendii FP15055 ss-10 TaxID=1314674 RepID=A0A0D7B5R1_9AGAR|nr:hypothetical protein CYLTODRAFT_423925 [Cylindrobasidium torrendii FP15055 ss-10]
MPARAVSRPWTEEEDALLKKAMKDYEQNEATFDTWKDVAKIIPGRSNKACRKRWLHSLSPEIKKCPWTAPEDKLLLELHAKLGGKWSAIARSIPGRTDDSCAKRFRETLDPKLIRGAWSEAEDNKLLEVYQRLGCKWREVGQEMSRGSLDCRNRHRLIERRNPQQAQVPSSTNSDPTSSSPSVTRETTSRLDPPCSDSHDTDVVMNEYANQCQLPSPLDLPCAPSSYASAMQEIIDMVPPFQCTFPCADDFRGPHLGTLAGSPPPLPHDGTRSPSPVISSDNFLGAHSATQLDDIFLPPWMFEKDFTGPHELSHLSRAVTLDLSHLNRATLDQTCLAKAASFPLPSGSPAMPSMASPWLSPVTSPDISPDATPSQSIMPLDTPVPSPITLQVNTPMASGSSVSDDCSPRWLCNPQTDIPGPSDVLPSLYFNAPSLSDSLFRMARKRKPPPPDDARLSAYQPVNADIKPYACGYPSCWPSGAASSKSCYATSGDLADHMAAHRNDPYMEKPYRCALCLDKQWKNANGLQYHLQMSLMHFQDAVRSAATPGPSNGKDKATGKYKCSQPGCEKTYKALSGLFYHTKHGHQKQAPTQIDDVTPALIAKLKGKRNNRRRESNDNIAAPL